MATTIHGDDDSAARRLPVFQLHHYTDRVTVALAILRSFRDEPDKLKELEHSGAPQTLLDSIKDPAMQAELVEILASTTLTVTVDIGSVERSLLRKSSHADENDALEYMTRYGAPTRLLQRLFGLSRRQATDRVHKSKASLKGRAQMPTPAERELIHAAWSAIKSNISGSSRRSEWQRIIALHSKFPAYKIGALDNVVHEYDAATSSPHKPDGPTVPPKAIGW